MPRGRHVFVHLRDLERVPRRDPVRRGLDALRRALKGPRLPSERPDVRIHPTADVSDSAVLGPGTSVWNHAQVRERATLGRECIVGKDVYIDLGVIVGDRCKIQNGAQLFHGVTLGNGVFVGPGAMFTNDLRPRAITPDGALKVASDWTVGETEVGDGAAIGAGAIILPGVRIGRWAMVAAGAVVTRSVPDHGLAAGNPARRIGWVCACGEKAASAEGGQARCACGRTFAIVETSSRPT